MRIRWYLNSYHDKRVWSVKEIQNAEELAEVLTGYTWTLCSGFRYNGYLFLNDSFSEDGAQEYGIIKETTEGIQVETVTFSWCSYEQALQLIKEIVQGDFDNGGWNSKIDIILQVQTPKEHGRCQLCA